MAILASNAQAAMPEGGKMTFAVSTVEVDDENAPQYPSLMPGNYVLLSVSDTGEGMIPEVKARLFEPFFSTREFGHGSRTGAGINVWNRAAKRRWRQCPKRARQGNHVSGISASRSTGSAKRAGGNSK